MLGRPLNNETPFLPTSNVHTRRANKLRDTPIIKTRKLPKVSSSALGMPVALLCNSLNTEIGPC